MRRFYDFNVWSEAKISEKLHYIHQNPVTRGLVDRPDGWNWSSFRAYACKDEGPLRINDWSRWEQKIKLKAVSLERKNPHFCRKNRGRNGAPMFFKGR